MSVIRLLFPDAQFGGTAVADAIQFAILGLGAGAAYTLLAQGIVLIYRGSGIVNFAHGGIAMFCAYFCFLSLVEQHGWPVGAAIPVAVLAGGLLGWLFQNGILRFMRATAPLVRLVATLGVLIVLQGLAGQKLWDNDFHQVDQFLPTQLHAERVVRLQRRAGRGRRPGGPPDPARHRDRAHRAALGLHPVHQDRARDLGQRRERAGGVGARMVAELPRHGDVGDRRCHRRLRRHPARPERRPEPDRVHDRRDGLRARGRVDRRLRLVPADPARWHRPRDRRDRGAALLQRHQDLVARHVRDRERRHRPPTGDAVPRDRRRARGPRQGAAAAQPCPRAAPRPRHRRRDPVVPRRGRRRVARAQHLRVRRRVVDRDVHLADRRRVHPVDRRAHRLRRSAVARPVRDRWARCALRRPVRGVGRLAGGARIPRRCGLRDGRGPGLRHPRAPHPRREPRRRHPRPRVRRPAGGLQQRVLHRRLRLGDTDRPDQGVRMGRQRRRTPRALSRRVPRVLRARGPDGREPPALPFGATAHRRAQQRARRGVARDQRVRRQALRLRVGAAIAAFAGILLAFKDSTVVYDRYDPFQSINTVGNAVAGGVGWVLGAVFGGHLAPGGIGSWLLDSSTSASG